MTDEDLGRDDDWIRCMCNETFHGPNCEEMFAEHISTVVQLDEPGHGRAAAYKKQVPYMNVAGRRVMGNFGFDEDDDEDVDEDDDGPGLTIT